MSTSSTFDWGNYLALAERWFTEDADEATLRSCVSRACYAAFYAASGYMRRHTEIPRRDTHLLVWRWFTVHSSKELRNAGSIGGIMRRSRMNADYNSALPCTPAQAREAIERATTIIAALAARHS